MYRTDGAWWLIYRWTQRYRAGLTSGAPPALGDGLQLVSQRMGRTRWQLPDDMSDLWHSAAE
jgi:hypothetical protein